MKQVICDKCKKVFKEEDFDKVTREKLPYKKVYQDNIEYWYYENYDLCNECVAKLNDLIEQTKCDFITKG